MHRRRLLITIGASALIALGSLPLPAFAAGPDRVPQRIDFSKIDPTFRSHLADANRQVNVVLQLAARPALGVATTRAGQQAAADRLRTAQKPVVTAVKRTGAKVTASYRYTYNGLRVRTTMGKLGELAAIPGVVAVRPLRTFTRTNVNGVPAIGGPVAWEQSGATGAGVIVAVIDTGIDYTHANFGGPGTEEAYAENDPEVVESGSFPTRKVIAGYDFAGNDYDANGDAGSTTPTPDDDPLDCGAHGSHVAGTVAGEGVLADHSTYTGLYNEDTISDAGDWTIGPGVAPEAKLVALKVFGCEGSTDLVVDALEWVGAYNAMHVVGIDVVNMSLGSPFGDSTDVDAVASDNLVASGVVVVASAGNESSVPFITGAPAVATAAISVAAYDATPTLPMATIENSGADIPGINQNAYPGLPVGGNLHVLSDGGSGVSLGCDVTDYDGATAGAIVAVKRGVCAFVEKGAAAEAAGAIGIIVINRDDTDPGALPTFIGYSPEEFEIPMVGTDKVAQAALIAIDGEPVTLASAGAQANPAYREITDFSSSGPRWGDNALKPDVAAPGANVLSTLNGSGWKGTTYSGTSMAAPMTAGAAALVIQAHPAWPPLKVKAALVNTADADSVIDYDPERAGSGLIAVDRATEANVVATTGTATASLSYGYVRANGAWSASRTITLWNDGTQPATYTLAASTPLVSLSPSVVTVPAGSSMNVVATASLSKATVKALDTVDQFLTGDFTGLFTMSGVVVATPSSKIAGQESLRIPYLAVPRGVSNVKASIDKNWSSAAGIKSGKLLLANPAGHSGWADVYALGFTDRSGDGDHGTDVAAAGVKVQPTTVLGFDDPDDRAVTFAVNMHDRFSTASPHEIDIAVDTNGDGDADAYVIAYDLGLLFAGAYSGQMISIITDASFNIVDIWEANAPLNGSTIEVPALASDLGLADGAGSFTYMVYAFDGYTGAADVTKWSKAFDAFDPTISTGKFKEVDAKSATKVKAWFQKADAPRGWLVITLDDRNGSQGDIVRVPLKK
jgi:subtilisin family serine protease